MLGTETLTNTFPKQELAWAEAEKEKALESGWKIHIAIIVPDRIPNSQVHSQAKLKPLIPEAHENHELLPGTAAIYTQSQKPAGAHGKFLILSARWQQRSKATPARTGLQQ